MEKLKNKIFGRGRANAKVTFDELVMVINALNKTINKVNEIVDYINDKEAENDKG